MPVRRSMAMARSSDGSVSPDSHWDTSDGETPCSFANARRLCLVRFRCAARLNMGRTLIQPDCTRQAESAGFLLLDAESLHHVRAERLTVPETGEIGYKSAGMPAPERFAFNVKRLLGTGSQRQLAQKLGVSPSLISQWIRGDTGTTLAQLDRIAHALGVDVSELLADASVARTAPEVLQNEYDSGKSSSASQQGDYVPSSRDSVSALAAALLDAARALNNAATELSRQSVATPRVSRPPRGKGSGGTG